MNTLIIYKSIHLGGTKKIAEEIGEALNADVIDAKDFVGINLDDYDLIGLGSGIYDGGFHKQIYNLVEVTSEFAYKNVFLFSTGGVVYEKSHSEIRERVTANNCVVVGDYYSKGHNKNSFLKYFGGMNKGRPNNNDLDRARKFAVNLTK